MRYTVLGTFSKGVDGSLTVNFSRSAGRNCSKRCRMLRQGRCYAAIVEKRPDRIQLADKLARHEAMGAALVSGRAAYELSQLLLRGVRVPWLRISSQGSVPMPGDVTPRFRAAFRQLLDMCKRAGIPVHLPVETARKAAFYRALVGDLVVVRESAEVDHKRFLESDTPISAVAGAGLSTYRERIAAAHSLAAQRRESSGRKCIVCPAVISSFNKRMKNAPWSPNAKCGNCTMCANALVDIVYPQH